LIQLLLSILISTKLFAQEASVDQLGTLNTIQNGFATVAECQSDQREGVNCAGTALDESLKDILNLTTTNQCVASSEELQNTGIAIPNCPEANDSLKGLDHSYPSGGIFSVYTGNNDGFIEELLSEYLDDNPGGRFNLVLPRTHQSFLKYNPQLTQLLNNDAVNIIQVETMPSVGRWMQDSFEFASLDGKPAIYQLEHYREEQGSLEDRLACQIAKSCNLPYYIPPDMVDPYNSDSSSLNSGGNLETMPGGTLYRGIIKSDGFPSFNKPEGINAPYQSDYQRIQRESLEAAGNKVLDLDTSFLSVGHVDEIINIVKTNRPAPCDFAVILASPEKAFELMEATAQRTAPTQEELEQELTRPIKTRGSISFLLQESASPRDLKCRDVGYYRLIEEGASNRISSQRVDDIYDLNCMDEQSIHSFVESDEYQILKNENLEGYTSEDSSISDVMQENKDALLAELADTTGCSNPPIVDAPVFFRGGVSYAPDLVNGVVHSNAENTSSIIMPRTYFRPFDEYMEKELSNLGVGATFVHAMGYHKLDGQVHCGTNTARVCK